MPKSERVPSNYQSLKNEFVAMGIMKKDEFIIKSEDYKPHVQGEIVVIKDDYID